MRRLASDQSGTSAMEFALAAPVLVMFLVGLAQLGMFLEARAGLQHAVGEGARYATIYPRPSDANIIAKVNARRFGLNPAFVTGPTVTHGTADGIDYADVTMSYNAKLNFILLPATTITLSETRRAFLP